MDETAMIAYAVGLLSRGERSESSEAGDEGYEQVSSDRAPRSGRNARMVERMVIAREYKVRAR